MIEHFSDSAGNRDQLYYTENLHSRGVEYSQIKSTYSLELCFSLPSTGPYPCELKDLSKLTKKKVVSAIDFVNLEANGLPTLSHLNPRIYVPPLETFRQELLLQQMQSSLHSKIDEHPVGEREELWAALHIVLQRK